MKINWNKYLDDASLGISYWASYLGRNALGEPVWVEDDVDLDGGGGMKFVMSAELLALGASRVESFQMQYPGYPGVDYLSRELLRYPDDPDLDIDDLDVLVQLAVFNDVIYG